MRKKYTYSCEECEMLQLSDNHRQGIKSKLLIANPYIQGDSKRKFCRLILIDRYNKKEKIIIFLNEIYEIGN
jgi:hypothetical protein